MLIFATKKRRKELDMTTLMMILLGVAVGVVVGLMDPGKPKMKNKKKSSRRSVWDDDPFFGTPLQKID